MLRWLNSPIASAVQRALVAERAARGLTQRDLAALVKMPPSVIAKIELGERRVDIGELIAFATAFQLPPADLLKRIEAGL